MNHLTPIAWKKRREKRTQFSKDNPRPKEKGVKLGNPNPQNVLIKMVAANKAAKVEFATKIFRIIQEIKSAGVETLQGICECLNRRGIQTRNGKNWYPATVRNFLKIQNA